MPVSLQKNQTLSLRKPDGTTLTTVRLGLGWDAIKRGFFGRAKDIDLDASALLFDQAGKLRDLVFYGQLKSGDGSIRHTGDNLTGDGDGDDEQILVDLAKVAPDVTHIVLTITSYSGQTFDDIENVFARIVDTSGGREVETIRYELTDTGRENALLVAKLTRSGAEWTITGLSIPAHGRTPQKVVDAARAAL